MIKAMMPDISGFLLITSQRDINIILAVIFLSSCLGWALGFSAGKSKGRKV